MVFFGTEHHQTGDVDNFTIPIEVVGGVFFLMLALVMIGPGQELGRALDRIPNRLLAYTVNIFGSIVGIVLFGLCSWYELPPLYWFVVVVLGMGYFLVFRHLSKGGVYGLVQVVALVAIIALAAVTSASGVA